MRQFSLKENDRRTIQSGTTSNSNECKFILFSEMINDIEIEMINDIEITKEILTFIAEKIMDLSLEIFTNVRFYSTEFSDNKIFILMDQH